MAKQKKTTLPTWDIEALGAQMVAELRRYGQILQPYQQELIGLLVLIITALTILNLLGLSAGVIPRFLGNIAYNLFGWGAIPVTCSIALLSGQLVARLFKKDIPPLTLEMIIGAELALIASLAVLHLLAGGNDPLALAKTHGGGGFIGWSLAILLEGLVGHWVAIALFGIIALAGLGLTFKMSLGEPELWLAPEDETVIAPPATQPVSLVNKLSQRWKKKREKTQPAPVATSPATVPSPATPLSPQPAMAMPASAKTIKLPPVNLLAAPAANPGQKANNRYQAQIIEDTLHSFGVPAKVIEANYGPTVTQFGVKPGVITKKLSDGTIVEQRVRVSKINALINDLALALAAAPIRIETPVPGRPMVGIEVPNGTVSMVSLRSGLETADFKNAKGPLKVPLGKGVSGGVTCADITALPHLLIAGATGSGKSVCINAIITSLLMTHPPENLKMLMIDPKMVELTAFNGIPHLIAPVVTDFEQVGGALAWVTREMERRYKAFATMRARSLASYNKKVEAADRLPFLTVIIDELADLMMLAADEVERYICRIAQMARATGIHMIIATQRPSTDVVTGLIKANFPARIAFAVTSQIDSRVILDTSGAEKLLGKGDMLYQAPDSPKLARLQGCFVSDNEINAVVRYWKRGNLNLNLNTPNSTPHEVDPADLPWSDILEEANKDEMLEEAIKLILDTKRASTTFLQRKLGIGYPRASRLMDQLEEEGVIGPADKSNHREILWDSTPT